MKTIDFSRSFLTFRIDVEKKPPRTVTHKPPFSLNNARIQIECHCHVVARQTAKQRWFVLGASCKTERVGVERDLWLEPNADFVPVFSEDGFLNIKTYCRTGIDMDFYPPGSGRQSDRQTGTLVDAFDSVRVDLVHCQGTVLSTASEIVEATLANRPLVARTHIEAERFLATIEYPIKTMNANERDGVYQADTGPVLFPDLDAEPDVLLERFELAFAAFNRADWTEFLVRVPTRAAEGVDVYHYSRPVGMAARNEVLCL